MVFSARREIAVLEEDARAQIILRPLGSFHFHSSISQVFCDTFYILFCHGTQYTEHLWPSKIQEVCIAMQAASVSCASHLRGEVKHWNGLPREVVNAPSQCLKRHLDKALNKML